MSRAAHVPVMAAGGCCRLPARLLLACLMVAVFSLPAVADFTANGILLYEDRPFDLNGFTGEQRFLPIRRADVVLMFIDADSLSPDTIDIYQ